MNLLQIDGTIAAAWASAIGTFVAAGAALLIALWQDRSAARVRQIHEHHQHERQARLIAEVIRLIGEIEAIANAVTQNEELGAVFDGFQAFDEQVVGIRAQLAALQQFPQEDPRLFGEIGRIVRETEFPRGFATGGTSYKAVVYRDMGRKLAECRAALPALLGGK